MGQRLSRRQTRNPTKQKRSRSRIIWIMCTKNVLTVHSGSLEISWGGRGLWQRLDTLSYVTLSSAAMTKLILPAVLGLNSQTLSRRNLLGVFRLLLGHPDAILTVETQPCPRNSFLSGLHLFLYYFASFTNQRTGWHSYPLLFVITDCFSALVF